MADPICKHFGTCGGCKLQHLDAATYLAQKQQTVADAFERAGLPTDALAPIFPCEPASRRRVTVSARRTKKTIQVGFYKAQSHDLLHIDECPILIPQLQALLPKLPVFLRPFMSRKGVVRAMFTHSETGIACAIDGDAKEPDPETTQGLASAARKLGICEIAFQGEPLLTHTLPMIDMAGTQVRLSPNAFLQATKPAERAMQDIITGTIRDAKSVKRVTDLFAGIGTFTFAAARLASVHAVEIDQGALDALLGARDRTQGLKEITAQQRNLMRNPLPADKLASSDVVIFDPPRAGAEAQVREIALAKPSTVIAVSCDPSTLARDLKILTANGYKLNLIQPIDQFVFSPHVEVVAVLTQ